MGFEKFREVCNNDKIRHFLLREAKFVAATVQTVSYTRTPELPHGANTYRKGFRSLNTSLISGVFNLEKNIYKILYIKNDKIFS